MACLRIDYASTDDIARRPAGWWRGVMGVVGFGMRPPALTAAPVAASMTPSLRQANGLCEVWRVMGDPENDSAPGESLPNAAGAARRGRVSYRQCGEFLFGSVALDETDFGRGAAALRAATTSAYQEIFGVLEGTRFAHLVRVWNYLADINGEVDGEERYRHFNGARQSAFRAAGRGTVGSVPAACALGSAAGSPLAVYFIASARQPTLIENPRQTSAYFYPPQFGDHSPTFSRACVLQGTAGTNLFISGTASIVGYESVHPGDAAAQTRETLVNIRALLDEANRIVGASTYALERLRLKVYVRREADLRDIECTMAPVLGMIAPVYLQADICREELLVEIEATGDSQR